MAFDLWGKWGVRAWEFSKFRIDGQGADPDEVEAETTRLMVADGWEYVATTQDRGHTWAVFKRADGETAKKEPYNVLNFGAPKEVETASGIDRSKKMTDAEKLGKRRR